MGEKNSIVNSRPVAADSHIPWYLCITQKGEDLFSPDNKAQ
jgi:hypothetical protein